MVTVLRGACCFGASIKGRTTGKVQRFAARLSEGEGDVVQLVRMLPCHGRGRGFEPRRPRQIPEKTINFQPSPLLYADFVGADGFDC
jgi:hypothetical protein